SRLAGEKRSPVPRPEIPASPSQKKKRNHAPTCTATHCRRGATALGNVAASSLSLGHFRRLFPGQESPDLGKCGLHDPPLGPDHRQKAAPAPGHPGRDLLLDNLHIASPVAGDMPPAPPGPARADVKLRRLNSVLHLAP